MARGQGEAHPDRQVMQSHFGDLKIWNPWEDLGNKEEKGDLGATKDILSPGEEGENP